MQQDQIMGYDRSATMLSPDGRILQVEYAEKSVRLGSASIGIVCGEGVVIIADKGDKDKLIVSESADKIYEIDEHIITSAAGILSDARVLINQVRVSSQQHRITYDTPIDVESVIREISDIKQQYTQHPGVRPFAAALMVAGINGEKCKLYTSDITGNYFEYNAIAIGKDDERIKEMLRKEYKKDIKIEDAIKLGLKIFKEILKEKFNIQRFNISYIKNEEHKFKRLNDEELGKFG